MDEELKLIDSYYAVAASMKAHGEKCIGIAETLATIADRMSDARIARHTPQPQPPSQSNSAHPEKP